MVRGRPRKGMKKEKPINVTVKPPDGQPIRKTNQLQYVSRKIVGALIQHNESWPFLELITPQRIQLPNYYELVKQPMSLRIVKKRLANNFYLRAKDAVADVRLIFKNALLASKPQSLMAVMAMHLYELLVVLWAQRPKPEMAIQTNGRPINERPSEKSESQWKTTEFDRFARNAQNGEKRTLPPYALRRYKQLSDAIQPRHAVPRPIPVKVPTVARRSVIDDDDVKYNCVSKVEIGGNKRHFAGLEFVRLQAMLDNWNNDFAEFSTLYDKFVLNFLEDIEENGDVDDDDYFDDDDDDLQPGDLIITFESPSNVKKEEASSNESSDEIVLVDSTVNYSLSQTENKYRIIIND